jgi:hypothetical protein
MRDPLSTVPKVFIIESLDPEDEEAGDYEGVVISHILKLSRIDHKYYYIRTEQELIALI